MSLSNKKQVIITGGPTREWIDPVRFISNTSSGKMGLALAWAAYKKQYITTFIHGPIETALLADLPFKTIDIETTSQLLNKLIDIIQDNTILIMAAAPVDYTVKKYSSKKIKKSGNAFSLQLIKTPDILKKIAHLRKERQLQNLIVIGFAAETDHLEINALKKLKEKELDMICLNNISQVGAGFNVDTNIVTLYKRNKQRIQLPLMSKQELAVQIFSEIESL